MERLVYVRALAVHFETHIPPLPLSNVGQCVNSLLDFNNMPDETMRSLMNCGDWLTLLATLFEAQEVCD
jgi:hypothetical protein